MTRSRPHLDIDRDKAERSLAGPVLTVVELLRPLMERQAVRRVDEGDRTDAQIEETGSTLMRSTRRWSGCVRTSESRRRTSTSTGDRWARFCRANEWLRFGGG